MLVYEPNTANEETVTLPGLTANGPLHQDSYRRGSGGQPRQSGAVALGRGLPYDPTQDAQVVPYFKIID